MIRGLRMKPLKVITAAAFITLAVLATGGAAADTFSVTLVSQTDTTITLGWTPQTGYGYLFSADGQLVSRTNDPARSTVRFSKSYSAFEIAVIVKGAIGTYPPPVTPAQCADGADNDNDGKIDYPADPGCASASDDNEVDEPPAPQCSDNLDNDGDGKIDMADPGCASVTDNDETDPPPTTANLFVSVNGNDAGNCTQSAPCRTFERAYRVASCDAIVQVENGSYPDQQIVETSSGSACNGHPIVFQNAPGTQPTVHYIKFGSCGSGSYCSDAADNVTLRGFKLTWGMRDMGDGNNVTLDDIDGGSFAFAGGGGNNPSNITVKNSDWGPCGSQGQNGDCRNFYIGDGKSGQPRIWSTSNVLIANNVFHDMTREASGDHFECAWIGDGNNNVTFRGNHFYNCEQYGIALPGNMQGDWYFENNWFGYATHSMLKFGPLPPAGNVYIRFNSFGPGQALNNEEGGSANGHVFVVGNILSTSYYFQSPTCIGGAVYDYNVFLNGFSMGGEEGTRFLNSGTCGSHAVQTSVFPYVNPSIQSAGDYHLAGPSVADGYVPTSAAHSDLAIDKDGDPRLGPRDAGADER